MSVGIVSIVAGGDRCFEMGSRSWCWTTGRGWSVDWDCGRGRIFCRCRCRCQASAAGNLAREVIQEARMAAISNAILSVSETGNGC